MTNVLIDVFSKELIDVGTSFSQNILIKFFDGNRTHFACKNQRYEFEINQKIEISNNGKQSSNLYNKNFEYSSDICNVKKENFLPQIIDFAGSLKLKSAKSI